jgi:hypothetical protein
MNQVEYNVMEHYKQYKGCKDKQNVYSLRNQLRTGNVRIYGSGCGGSDTVPHLSPPKNSMYESFYVLKISGIWETATHVGITYKFMNIGTPIIMRQ